MPAPKGDPCIEFPLLCEGLAPIPLFCLCSRGTSSVISTLRFPPMVSPAENEDWSNGAGREEGSKAPSPAVDRGLAMIVTARSKS